ncbi:ABC transporter permease [Bartonella tamiae]|uniref:ABC transmembrane type-1 domain-containing protein n=1 Tax=Bartonella tamiae Th239 TaxID=1094558 RepID=J1JX09_9HYPH|nr:ABC transporter permease [Bartonella tamiae]EJF89135.1 hypothetical protein ME5_01686 [Bartonella tamiae Th239]EJF95462.1 hypothetical protein MEG_00195 [Bartonella tamiae Th307]
MDRLFETNILKPRIKHFGVVFKKPDLLVCLLVLFLALGFIMMPWVFSAYNPIEEVGPHLSAPSFAHWLGTDELGRDLYSRIVYGAVYSLSGAMAAVIFGFMIGGLLGLFSGFVGGLFDVVVMRFIDMLLSIPSLLLSLSLITLLGSGTLQIAVAVGVPSIAGFTRLSRAEVARIRTADFIEAAFGSGASFFQVLYRHVLPNAFYTLIGYSALQFGHALLQIATLGFLGYSVQPPTPEWGLLIAEGRNYVATAWWLTIMPGLFVIAVVISTNRLSHFITARGAL